MDSPASPTIGFEESAIIFIIIIISVITNVNGNWQMTCDLKHVWNHVSEYQSARTSWNEQV